MFPACVRDRKLGAGSDGHCCTAVALAVPTHVRAILLASLNADADNPVKRRRSSQASP
jgi:hypothetical protein